MHSPLRSLAARAAVVLLALTGAASAAEPMIRGGGGNAIYLDADGTVWAWGLNDHGQLGQSPSSFVASWFAQQIGGLSRITAVAAGDGFCVALAADGTVWTWGRNDVGQLGSSLADRSTPLQLPPASVANIIAIAAGAKHVLALRGDGRVISWGGDTSGQCGAGATTTTTRLPTVIARLDRITAIGCGASHSLAVRADGTVWTWADNAGGG